MADLLNRVRPAFNVNSLALAAAEAALKDRAFIDESRRMNAAGLVQLRDGLQALGVGRGCRRRPTSCWPGFDRSGRRGSTRRCSSAGVIVRPVGNYGLDRDLRITVGTERQNRRLLDALGEILEG